MALSPTLYVLSVRRFADLVSSLRFCFWGCWGFAGNAIYPYVPFQTPSSPVRSFNDSLARPPSLGLVPSLTTKRTTNIRNPMFPVLSYPHTLLRMQRKLSYREWPALGVIVSLCCTYRVAGGSLGYHVLIVILSVARVKKERQTGVTRNARKTIDVRRITSNV